MKKREDRSRSAPPAEGASRASSPFAQLESLRATLPPAVAPAPEASKAEKKGPARAVIRLERKGRGGKEATVVEQLGLPGAELDAWLVALKNALGCGGTVEDGSLVLQGDQRPRLPGLLSKRGVRRVISG